MPHQQHLGKRRTTLGSVEQGNRALNTEKANDATEGLALFKGIDRQRLSCGRVTLVVGGGVVDRWGGGVFSPSHHPAISPSASIPGSPPFAPLPKPGYESFSYSFLRHFQQATISRS